MREKKFDWSNILGYFAGGTHWKIGEEAGNPQAREKCAARRDHWQQWSGQTGMEFVMVFIHIYIMYIHVYPQMSRYLAQTT